MIDRDLEAYLARIGYSGRVRPDLQTLVGIHRAHATTIPFENLEIQFGRANLLDETAFVEKLVHAGRGGWCFEMNGLLTLMLRRAGFRVTRVGGAASRPQLGDDAIGNHLLGLVDLDRRYVVDVGMGDGPLEPFPLEEREWTERGLRFALERLDDDWWRIHNHEHGLAATFDFTEEPRDLTWYQDRCTALQTEESSPFVQYAIAIRCSVEGLDALRDTTHFHVADGQCTRREVTDSGEYVSLLERILGIDLGEASDTLWSRVSLRASRRSED